MHTLIAYTARGLKLDGTRADAVVGLELELELEYPVTTPKTQAAPDLEAAEGADSLSSA